MEGREERIEKDVRNWLENQREIHRLREKLDGLEAEQIELRSRIYWYRPKEYLKDVLGHLQKNKDAYVKDHLVEYEDIESEVKDWLATYDDFYEERLEECRERCDSEKLAMLKGEIE